MSPVGRSVHAAALGALFAVAAMLCGAGKAHAVGCAVSSSVYQLSDQNSVACVNVNTQAGLYDWYVDGLDQLSQQWFWYRIGSSGPEHSIDTLGTPTVVSSANELNVTYNGTYVGSAGTSAFTVKVQYTLTGQADGTGKSHLHEVIDVTRTSGPPISIYLYQYSNFDLGFGPGHENDDTVEFVAENRMLQYDPASVYPSGFGTLPIDFAQTMTTSPNYCEVGTVGAAVNTLGKLNNAMKDNLSESASGSNCGTPVTGDVAWAFEWGKSLTVTSPTLHIAGDTDLTIALPSDGRANLASVPEPVASLLFVLGALALGALRRRAG